MGFGLFGKLPQKRDFISLGISGDVLSPLETWLQTAVAASRSELGRGWEATLSGRADLAFLDRRRRARRQIARAR